MPFWQLKRRKGIQRLRPGAPLLVEKLYRIVANAGKSYLVKEEDGWLWTTVRPANDPPRYADFSGRMFGGGPLPLKEMVAESEKAAVEDTSIFFLLDVPTADMIQPDFVWELVQAFANRPDTSKPSEKTFLAVFLQPQALSACWPDRANELLACCSDCSGRETDVAPGIDGIAVVDACHLDAGGQRLTVELFFLRGPERDQVTSIRVRYGVCSKEAANGTPVAVESGPALARRIRYHFRKRKADVYIEAFKYLRRTELDCCELVGKSWFQLIRSVSGVLPLRRITSAVTDPDSTALRCRMMESGTTPRTGTFELTGGQLSALDCLRNSCVDTMRMEEATGIVVNMLADWLKAKDNRMTAANLLVRVPFVSSRPLDPVSFLGVLSTIRPVTLQLSFDPLQRNFRLLKDGVATPTGGSGDRRLTVVKAAIRDTHALLDFVLHRRQSPVLLVSTESTGQDADWLVMTLIECFQQQSELGTLHLPLYLEYVGNDPVLLDLDNGAVFEKHVEQCRLLFPTSSSETGVYSSFTERQLDVYELFNHSGDAVLLHVSRKPNQFGVADGIFKRYIAFIPSRAR